MLLISQITESPPIVCQSKYDKIMNYTDIMQFNLFLNVFAQSFSEGKKKQDLLHLE